MTPEGFLTGDIRTRNSESSKEKTEITSCVLWGNILRSHPEITDVILAYYHEPGRHDKVRRYNASKILKWFDNNQWPSPDNTENLNCAISSVFGTTEEQKSNVSVKPNNSKRLSLSNPFAIPQFDFSCPVNANSRSKLEGLLNELNVDWFLLASGKSYHAIIAHPIELRDLPYLWGVMMENASLESENDFAKARGLEIADSLKHNHGSPIGLRMDTANLFNRTFDEITTQHGGFSEFSGYTFIDWGHISYSLNNYLNFLRGMSAGTEYLRLSGKNGFSPPILITRHIGGSDQRFEIPENYFSLQMELKS